MCGIFGYVGDRAAARILLDGIRRLEYRGYDSAGLALVGSNGLWIRKVAGKIADLERRVADAPADAFCGVAHTRWATHGDPTDVNAHPHVDPAGVVAVVHNGIIENHRTLRRLLEEEDGASFASETDTEVLAHLVAKFLPRHDLTTAVRTALRMVHGTYGIAVVSAEHPGEIVAACHGAPLVLGIDEGAHYVASDAAALVPYTRRVIYLDTDEIVTVRAGDFQTIRLDAVPVEKEVEEITWEIDQIEKGGHPHFMRKEIFEQPETLANAMRGRMLLSEGTARLQGLNLQLDELRKVERVVLLACGTSWHAALIGEYLIEEIARVPVEVEYASEFRYRNPIVEDKAVYFAISQSGETADTLAAMREAKARGGLALGIVNVVGSTIARESEGGVYIHAGPEIGVASTKAFTSQIVVLVLIALLLGRQRDYGLAEGKRLIRGLLDLPAKARTILDRADDVRRIAATFCNADNALYLGRGIHFPVALEGALKLKEISYIHAEGYPAAEMKHGPIALIDENMPVVVLALRDGAYEKILSNIEEVRARKGRVIAVVSEGDTEVRNLAEAVIEVPACHPLLAPILSVIPLQLLAYEIAVLRGCDVDQPRNLAKSVTVE